MFLSILSSSQDFTKYDAFTVHRYVDIARIAFILAAICAMSMMCFIAVMRWREGKKSATYFLCGYSVALLEMIFSTYKAIGFALTDMFIFRCVTLVVSFIAVRLAINEVKIGGVWFDERHRQ